MKKVFLVGMLFPALVLADCWDLTQKPVELWEQIVRQADYVSCSNEELSKAREILIADHNDTSSTLKKRFSTEQSQQLSYRELMDTQILAMDKSTLLTIEAALYKRGLLKKVRGNSECLSFNSEDVPLFYQIISLPDLYQCSDQSLKTIRYFLVDFVRHQRSAYSQHSRSRFADSLVAQADMAAEATQQRFTEVRSAVRTYRLNDANAHRYFLTFLSAAKATLASIPSEVASIANRPVSMKNCFELKLHTDPFETVFKDIAVGYDFSDCDNDSLARVRDFLLKSIVEYGKAYGFVEQAGIRLARSIGNDETASKACGRKMKERAFLAMNIWKSSLLLVDAEQKRRGIQAKPVTTEPPLIAVDSYGRLILSDALASILPNSFVMSEYWNLLPIPRSAYIPGVQQGLERPSAQSVTSPRVAVEAPTQSASQQTKPPVLMDVRPGPNSYYDIRDHKWHQIRIDPTDRERGFPPPFGF